MNDFVKLSQGDTVKHVTSEVTYTVMGNYGGRATAVKTMDITNPQEWELLAKAKHYKKGGIK